MGRANPRVRRDVRASRTIWWRLVRWWDVVGGGGSLMLEQNCPTGLGERLPPGVPGLVGAGWVTPAVEHFM